MNRKTILLGAGVIVAGAVVAILNQGKVRRPVCQDEGCVLVFERTVEGHAEYYTCITPLVPHSHELGPRLEGCATVYTDPNKPPFVFTVRRSPTPHEGWLFDPTQCTAMIIDGGRMELDPCETAGDSVCQSVSTFRFGGPRAILATIASSATNGNRVQRQAIRHRRAGFSELPGTVEAVSNAVASSGTAAAFTL